MPSTNFGRYARVPESTIGQTPASPAMQYAYFTGEGMKPTDAFLQSETIVGVRPPAEYIAVNQSVAGNINVEHALGWIDWLQELALFDRYAAGVEAYNATADSQITQVTASSQTIAAAGAWLPKMLVLLEGLVAGNGVIVAQASSGSGSIIAPAATFAADDSAPPAGARALYVGFEGAPGDLVTTAAGIQSTALNFTTMVLPARCGVKISGSATAAVNIFARVKSVSTNLLELDDLPATWAAGVGAGETLRIWVGELIEDGADVLTESHTKWNTKTSPAAYEKFIGVACNQLVIPFQTGQLVTGQASLVGFSAGVAVSPVFSGVTFAEPQIGVTNQVMKTGANVSRLVEGSTADATAACAQSMTWTIANNLTPVNCLAHDAPVGFNEGDFKLTIDGVWRFQDKTLLDKYHGRTPTQQLIVVGRANRYYMYKAYAGIFTDIGAPISARNGEHVVNGRFEAVRHATHGKSIGITRFRWAA